MAATAQDLSDERATHFMVALRGGATPHTFAVNTKSLALYLAINADYAREARPLMEENAKAARIRKGARLRNLTHCVHGHPLSGDNISLEPNGRRKCLACARRRHLAPRPPTKEQIERVTAALNAGQTLSLICHGRLHDEIVKPRILTYRKLNFYRRQNPIFDQFVISATENNISKGQRLRLHPEQARIEIVRSQNDDFHKILSMLPRQLANRDEIVGSIFLALAEGRLQRNQVQLHLPEFIRAQNAMFPINYAKFGNSPLLSLDEVMFDDGSATRGDTISRGLWD
jgi:hypothetical protein